MGGVLAHRGPDAAGVWRNDDCSIALAHRRLRVVELSEAGAQPMASANGRWVLAFNGEIYNHASLRKSLESTADVRWRGNSDTETLVEAIASWGVKDALQRCNGMFAFAAFDTRSGALTLARDRFGEKPLYLGMVGQDWVAGSELKAFREHPDWRHVVEPRALDWLLSFGFIPAPWTIHPGIFKLPAGAMIRIARADRLWRPDVDVFMSRVERWWDLGDMVQRAAQDPWTGSEWEAQALVGEALDRAVGLRHQADVPVGALLSGGIDSSLIVSSMVRMSAGGVKTFTVAFDEPDVNEERVAADTACRLGTDHTTVHLAGGAALASVQRVVDVFDEPFADVAQLPALLVADAARQSVTVALTGDGGDEAFHGYQRYLDGERNWQALRLFPWQVRRLLALGGGGMGRIVPPGRVSAALNRQASRVGVQGAEAYAQALLRFSGSESINFLDDPAWPRMPGWLSGSGFGARCRFLDQALLLPEGITHKLDRSSMAVGLELRCPFLDHELINLAWRLPSSLLCDGRSGKTVLRNLVAERGLADVSQRRKQGFDVPIGAWLRGALFDWADSLFRPAMQGDDPLLDAQWLSRVWRQHISKRADHGYVLWATLMYLAWCDRHGR
ncbi:asparagine synthase (glutamine-hydrolyzing) [Lysobacter sp. CAU 1642]|uniref:asparagine synthase (glutamine-hydrolyzing) n=2 Tax=Pseudomarimonas salicorniae TaxID=2933270 RepID=A0ABT0GFL1_9GAMM|nr:asparagine synthase (glutamine-hydrolyzing) [Lysobacter sp. CAU 1642]